MTRKEMKMLSKERMKGNWDTAWLILVLVPAITAFATLLTLGVGSIIVSGPLAMGTSMVYYSIALGRKADWKIIINPFKDRLSDAFVVGLISTVVLFIPILGIVLALAFAEAWVILINEPNISGIDALKKSHEIMKGRKGALFVMYLSFIGWLLLSMVTFGIALLYTIPYMETSVMMFLQNVYREEISGVTEVEDKEKEEIENTEDNYIVDEKIKNVKPKTRVKKESNGSGKTLVIILIVIIILGICGGGYYFYVNGNLPFLNNKISENQMLTDNEALEDTYVDDYSNDSNEYIIGGVYYVITPLKVREEADIDSRWLLRDELEEEDFNNSEDTEQAVLKKGAAVTCIETYGDWMRIASGWICCYEDGEYFVE